MFVERDGVKIAVVQGDLSRQDDVDGVVNAANAELISGGGVAGALHRAAGPELEAAGRRYAPIEPGMAVITPAFNLPNRYVIHCRGPVYGRDEPSAGLLAACYRRAMILAEEHGITSIAFPAISTGVFGYPVREAADVALRALCGMTSDLRHVRLIRMVLYSEEDQLIHEQALERQCPGAPK